MRAIFEGEDASPAIPTREPSFDAAFSEAVDAFLRKDYEAALTLFEDALRVEPENSVCLNNIRVIQERLERSGGQD